MPPKLSSQPLTADAKRLRTIIISFPLFVATSWILYKRGENRVVLQQSPRLWYTVIVNLLRIVSLIYPDLPFRHQLTSGKNRRPSPKSQLRRADQKITRSLESLPRDSARSNPDHVLHPTKWRTATFFVCILAAYSITTTRWTKKERTLKDIISSRML